MLRIAAGLLWLSNFTDSRVARDVSLEGELGGGTATAIGGMNVSFCEVEWGYVLGNGQGGSSANKVLVL